MAVRDRNLFEWQAYVITMAFLSVGLLLGVQVMTARHLGEGRPEATGGVLRRGLVYAFWIGVVSVLLLAFAGPPFLRLSFFGIEPGLAGGAGSALQIFALSLPLYLFAVVGQFFLEALSRPKASDIPTVFRRRCVVRVASARPGGGLGALFE